MKSATVSTDSGASAAFTRFKWLAARWRTPLSVLIVYEMKFLDDALAFRLTVDHHSLSVPQSSPPAVSALENRSQTLCFVNVTWSFWNHRSGRFKSPRARSLESIRGRAHGGTLVSSETLVVAVLNDNRQLFTDAVDGLR